MYLPGRGDNGPVLRTASLGVLDRLDVFESLHLEYGFNYESVTFLNRLNYLSPFGRASFDVSKHGTARFAFSSGTQPTQLFSKTTESELNQDLAALALIPRVSLRDAHARVERRESFEAGYQYVAGTRTYSVAAYRESVSNAAFLLSGPANFLSSADLLPQLGSSAQIFDLGDYHRDGFSASVAQSLGDHFDASLAAGRGGALTTSSNNVSGADGLRSAIQKTDRNWVTARVAYTLPKTGTRVIASYGWTDFRALMPAHISLTDKSTQDVGWNVYVRQPLPPLPGMFGSFGRFEASAELRNLLAQGYLPIAVDGQRAVLTNAPRAVRGGLSFIF
jgi:hypothetical protein